MLVAGLAAWVVFQLHILLEFGVETVDGQLAQCPVTG